jgi:hypothetical protein
MLDPKASRFWQAAIQSGLLDAHALQACWDAIPPEKRQQEHIDRRLARQAVQAGSITLWQAQQLVAGRSMGFKIDRYVLIDLIGQGGMGRVYLARDSRLDRRVALKILSPERVGNPRAIARFQREAKVGAQLQHENLVRIYDVGEATGKCYLVMEYIEGKNIGQMIAENGPIPPAIAAQLARQVALGLEHAQRKGLIHRDVNPYNILVTRDGTAKLTDMGLAIDLAETERVTRDGATVGTFDYISPEQARHSHSVDTRSDIYSLGCTLYHMLTGRVPFPTASLPEKLWGHQVAEPDPLATLVPGLPAGLEAVVKKMIKKSPGQRYATPLELALALEPFCEGGGGAGAGGGEYALAGVGRSATVSPVATTQTLKIAPPATEPMTEPALAPVSAATRVAAPILPTSLPGAGRAQAVSNSDSLLDLSLSVNLGPEPALSDGLGSARFKTKARVKPKVETTTEAEAASPSSAVQTQEEGNRWLLLGAAAIALLVVVVGGAIALRGLGRDGKATAENVVPKNNETSTKSTRDRGVEKSGTASKGGLIAPRKPEPRGKEVAVVAADGTRAIEPNLVSAMRAAIGGKGHVLLMNRTPYKVSAAEAISMSGGLLVIKADEGCQPVLHVEVKGRKPFLSTRGETTLRIEGVTIVATYLEPGLEPAPVIEAGGNVELDRCAFKVEGPAAGTRALALDGGSLVADGCWFENFDWAIDASCYAGSSTTLRHCMLVRTQRDDASGASPLGWAVRLRSMPGGTGQTGRRLRLDRCTVKGKGFLDLAGFSPHARASVNLTNCAVRTNALLAWEPDAPPSRAGKTEPTPATPAVPTRDALSWVGLNNQYDIRGEAWIVLIPRAGTETPMPDGPAALDSWKKLLGNEGETVPPPIRFATEPADLPEHPQPRDFAIADQGLTPPGADPALVGPGVRSLHHTMKR